MKKVVWLVQREFIQNDIESDFDILNKLGFNVIVFDLIPFENKIIGLDNLSISPDIQYIVRAGTNAMRVFENAGVRLQNEIFEKIRSELFYSECKFDQNNYLNINRLECVNSQSQIIDLSLNENALLSFEVDKFIKPTSDLKLFDAGILFARDTIKSHIENKFHHSNYKQSKVIISDLAIITSEYRFFVAKGEIIGGSRYFVNGKLNLSNNIPKEIINKAKEYINIYQPSDLFVIDLGVLLDGSIKVVEYNCFSASGTYSVDRKYLFSEINHIFS